MAYIGGRTKVPELFELVVFNSLPRNIFKWQIYNGKWVNHESWDFNDKEDTLNKGKTYRKIPPNLSIQ